MKLSAGDRQALVVHRIEQMRTAARSCRVLLDESDMQGAANRLYCSIFCGISAVAPSREKSFSRHGSLIGWFNREFVNTGPIEGSVGRFVSTAWKNRTRGDYQFIFSLTRDDLEESISTLEEFTARIDSLLKARS